MNGQNDILFSKYQRATLVSRPLGARFDLIARMLCYGTAFAYSVFCDYICGTKQL